MNFGIASNATYKQSESKKHPFVSPPIILAQSKKHNPFYAKGIKMRKERKEERGKKDNSVLAHP